MLAEYSQCGRRQSVRISVFVRPHVFLQMILPTESFPTNETRVRAYPRMNPLVPR